MVAAMTGHEPDLPRWLWSQNSEHRLPLPRLVNLALLRATGDFRSTMVFDTLALAAVAAGMILVARRFRDGRTSLADAFFPLLLLHLGNWDNLVWAWQIQFVLPTVLACALLLVIVARPSLVHARESRSRARSRSSACRSPAPTGWCSRRRSPPGSRTRRGSGGGTRAASRERCPGWRPGPPPRAALLCAVYFVGYEASPWNAPSPGLGATLATSRQVPRASGSARSPPSPGCSSASSRLSCSGRSSGPRAPRRAGRTSGSGSSVLLAFLAAVIAAGRWPWVGAEPDGPRRPAGCRRATSCSPRRECAPRTSPCCCSGPSGCVALAGGAGRPAGAAVPPQHTRGPQAPRLVRRRDGGLRARSCVGRVRRGSSPAGTMTSCCIGTSR